MSYSLSIQKCMCKRLWRNLLIAILFEFIGQSFIQRAITKAVFAPLLVRSSWHRWLTASWCSREKLSPSLEPAISHLEIIYTYSAARRFLLEPATVTLQITYDDFRGEQKDVRCSRTNGDFNNTLAIISNFHLHEIIKYDNVQFIYNSWMTGVDLP